MVFSSEQLMRLRERTRGANLLKLNMVVELKVQYCIENLYDSFDTNLRHFYGLLFLNKSVKFNLPFGKIFLKKTKLSMKAIV